MLGFTTVAVLHLVMAATGESYQAALGQAEQAGKPLLVLVGEAQLPAYRTMREQTMPELVRSGALERLVYVAVNADANPALTRQLVRGDASPQLVLYTQVGKLWRRTHVSGSQSPSEVLAFLEREIARGREVAARANRDKTTYSTESSNVIYSYSIGGS